MQTARNLHPEHVCRNRDGVKHEAKQEKLVEVLRYGLTRLILLDSARSPGPDPWADPKCRSTLGFCNLHHRSTRVQNWGIYIYFTILYTTILYHTVVLEPRVGGSLDPPGLLGGKDSANSDRGLGTGRPAQGRLAHWPSVFRVGIRSCRF